MPYGNALPLTGGAGAFVLGHYFGLDEIIAAAIAVVLFGITAYRYGSRLRAGRTTILLGLGTCAVALAGIGHVVGLSWGLAVTGSLLLTIVALAAVARNAVREPHAAA